MSLFKLVLLKLQSDLLIFILLSSLSYSATAMNLIPNHIVPHLFSKGLKALSKRLFMKACAFYLHLSSIVQKLQLLFSTKDLKKYFFTLTQKSF